MDANPIPAANPLRSPPCIASPGDVRAFGGGNPINGNRKSCAMSDQAEEAVAEKRGRPSEFTQDMADRICERLANGESLRAICRDDGFPSQPTVFRWIGNFEEFRKQYARAREAQADAIADEILSIADEDDDPAKARVRIDARKWLAGKMRPKVYGDKVSAEITGTDGGPVETITRIELVAPRGNSED